MNTKGMIILFAAMVALAVPSAMVASDVLYDDAGVSGSAIDELRDGFGDGDGINIEVDTQLILSLCILAAVGLIAIAYYYRAGHS